jgi:hypothetical protein
MTELILLGLFGASLSVDWLTGLIGGLKRQWLIWVWLAAVLLATYAASYAFFLATGGDVLK